MCAAEFAAWHRLVCGLHGLRPEGMARADLPTGGTDAGAAGAAGAAGMEPRRWAAAAEADTSSPPPPRAIRQAWGEAEGEAGAKLGEAASRSGGGGDRGGGGSGSGVARGAGGRPSPQGGGGGAAAEGVVDAALLSDLEAALEYFKQEVRGRSMRYGGDTGVQHAGRGGGALECCKHEVYTWHVHGCVGAWVVCAWYTESCLPPPPLHSPSTAPLQGVGARQPRGETR